MDSVNRCWTCRITGAW